MAGWIKLHRKVMDSPIFKDPEAFSLWMTILLKVNVSKGTMMMGGSRVDCPRGAMITSLASLSSMTGMSKAVARRRLELLSSHSMVVVITKPKYTMIRVTNWGEYQSNAKDAPKKSSSNKVIESEASAAFDAVVDSGVGFAAGDANNRARTVRKISELLASGLSDQYIYDAWYKFRSVYVDFKYAHGFVRWADKDNVQRWHDYSDAKLSELVTKKEALE